MRFRFLLALAAGLVCSSLAAAQLNRQVIVSGLNFPTHVAAPPDDTGRLFVVERAGIIRIIDLATKTVLPAPFLDIHTRVTMAGEGALYSIAFHPQYATNGFFFIFYTTDINPTNVFTLGVRVSRFMVSADPNVANAASEVPFLEQSKPSDTHNGGMVAFRPNDANHYLYISVGDGGPTCDLPQRAQDKGEKLGKILRIDVDAGPGSSTSDPNIPPTNPYVDASGDDAIWTLGLRNPYRFSFDRLTSDMYIGDVGQEAREEIDFLPAASAGGDNFGWNAREGTIAPPNCVVISTAKPDMIAPIYEYPHNGLGAAIAGGFVYRGADYPDIYGRYFFADFVTGKVASFIRNGAGITDLQDHTSILNPDVNFITSFGEDARGELYIVDLQGTVARIVSPTAPPPDVDQDLLANEVEDDGGVYVDPTQTGTDPFDPDSDDDGVWDGIEVFLGTDPNNPNDFPNLSAAWSWGIGAGAMLVLGVGIRYAWRLRRAR